MLLCYRSLFVVPTLFFSLTSSERLLAQSPPSTGENAPTSFVCPGNRVLNGDFDIGNTPGGIFGPGHVDNWNGGPGVAEVFTADGCSGGTLGSVGMLGRQDGGDMITQFQATPIFEAGKTYSVSLCVQYLDDPPLPLVQIYVDDANHVRFRVRASSQLLTTYTDPAGVIVGETPQLTVNGSWLTVTLPNWTSPADYNYLTINQFNDNPMPDSSWGEIDKICVTEVVPFCPGNVVANGDFDGGNIPGGILGPGHVDDWTGSTGVVEVFADDGCSGTSTGSVGMLGRQDGGDMMHQFSATPIFEAGRTYSVTLCARYLDDPPLPLVQIYVDDANHVRFRLSASNQVLGNYSDPAAVVIGETPQLTVNGSWVSMTLPNWTAAADYHYLSVNQFNDNPMPDSSWGEIDKICISEVPDYCPGNLVSNGDYSLGLVPGRLATGFPGNADDWQNSLRAPEVLLAGGCDTLNTGSIGMLGRADDGDAIHQTLPLPQIISGRTYSVSMCVRYVTAQPPGTVQIIAPANHVRFRVRASNGPLLSYADPAGVTVGETPQLTSVGSWTTVTLPNWTAPADYTTISINPFNDNAWPDSSYGEVDRICMTEVPQSGSYAYYGGWNLVSQPMVVADDTVTHIFPNAISLAYAFDPGGYVTHPVFQKPRGYWLKLPAPETLAVVGTPVDSMAIPLFAGWNLVGSITSPVGVATIVSVAGGLVTSPFYGYNNGYYVTDSVRPGFGYWVNVSDTGWLILDTTPGPVAERIRIVPTTARPPMPPDDVIGTEGVQGLPSAFSLGANFPNPFNPTTMIEYALPAESRVKISVYDVLGRELAVLADGVQSGGYRSVSFDAGNFTSGIYFYRLDAVATDVSRGHYTAVRKMLMMK